MMRRMLEVRRFVVFVALLLACGSSKEHVDTPPTTASATPSASASSAPVASASTSSTPVPVQLPTQISAWHPLLYRISGGGKPSYLFGTIHIPDARIAQFPDSLTKAVGESDEVITELPLDDTSPAHAMSVATMPNGKSLSSELPTALYARLKDVFVKKGMGMAFPMLEHMKVWAIAVQVTLIDHLQELLGGAKPIDMVLHDSAKVAKKKTSGLETEAEQLSVFEGLTKDEQARVLEQTLDQRDKDLVSGSDPIAKLMGLYVAGEETPLITELNAGFDLKRPLDAKLLKRLITDRNKIMTDRIAAKIKTAPPHTYFFAVGAAHLLGDDGIIAQLKKKTLTIDRVQ